eukprot:gene20960-25172_t
MVSKATFWNFFHALFWFIAIFCLWISGLNYEGLKYSRLSSRALPPAPFQQCSKLLVDLTHTDSWLCCEEGSQNVLWICTAANDGITRFLSSSWAWVIPFIPTALTAAIDAIVGSFHPVRQQNGWGHRMQVCLFFVLVRSFILYLLPYKLGEFMTGDSTEKCWAQGFVSKTKYVF